MAESPLTVATRHQVFLERLKTHEANKFTPYLREVDRQVREILTRMPDAPTARQLAKSLRELDAAQKSVYAEYIEEFLAAGKDITEAEAAFEAKAIQNAAQGIALTQAQDVYERVLELPLSTRDYNGGKLLTSFVDDWSQGEIDAVNNLVRRGVNEGRTVSQIILDIRGTSGRKFNDGQFKTTDRHARAMVRTAVQHMSSGARQAVWEDNQDLIAGVEWVSVLDGRTTSQCKSLDGQVFGVNDGPRPPIHVGCRSSTVMRLRDETEEEARQGTRFARSDTEKGQVSAQETYYSWIKKQSDEFQDAAMGPKRAKLFRDGGLSTERFRELSIGTDFEALSLKDMRDLEPLAFERAGVKV